MKTFEIIEGNVTTPKGFKASGIHAGIKKAKKDIALIVSEVPCEAAGVFTTNKACAAPVIVSKENIKDGKIQGIIVNSGNANACTGEQGILDAKEMIHRTAKALNLSEESVIVSSTGIIGVPMPMEVINNGIEKAVEALSYEGGADAAEGIMTTDLIPKAVAVKLTIDGKEVTIGGIAKGSGMIHPNMATMLSFVTTDINIDGSYLKQILTETTNQTYNMISVDGDTSTNDMVAVMANGLANNKIMDENHPEKEKFLEAFYFVHEYLAKTIVRDGEGATKFIEVEGINAPKVVDARKAVKSILNSSLVKTAFFGEDGNWGRILCSVGYSGMDFEMEKIEIYLSSEGGEVKIVEAGQGTGFLEEDVEKILKHKDIKITVDFNMGIEKAKGWGCDLSYDYVKINGAYRT
ncbi:bifunctional ornithine acetyltransferase/N-acetylglutamate synthase [Alkaliphilus transvaalensis]|uniref:bifunctional ornithine acetyltransferase/N-acetylglutamate synthase n=1 Tax=Alkaliphilus transvaalensis TaxID=114628 RepID=UPI00047D3FEF|nr:bifunctional ornithine acetyltransferase/N-acetylglutamate synthase [Alkaliphilus transvaalensis]